MRLPHLLVQSLNFLHSWSVYLYGKLLHRPGQRECLVRGEMAYDQQYEDVRPCLNHAQVILC